ncbi:mCG1051065 [Mus musculus]|nr:mCG1051065 [Mus musculus]
MLNTCKNYLLTICISGAPMSGGSQPSVTPSPLSSCTHNVQIHMRALSLALSLSSIPHTI